MTLTKDRPEWPTSSQSVKENVGQHRETCEGERTPTPARTATHSNLLECPQCAEGETPKPPPRGHNKDPLRLPGTVAGQGSLWCETTPPSRAHSNHQDCYGRPACQTSLTKLPGCPKQRHRHKFKSHKGRKTKWQNNKEDGKQGNTCNGMECHICKSHRWPSQRIMRQICK